MYSSVRHSQSLSERMYFERSAVTLYYGIYNYLSALFGGGFADYVFVVIYRIYQCIQYR